MDRRKIHDYRAYIQDNSTPEPNSGCWLWTGAVCRNGYGHIRVGPHRRPHRLSWTAFCGTIPVGIFVLHRCDNRLCVNPDHLFLGSQMDNVQDMIRKNRRHTGITRGEMSGLAKLTNEKVIRAREMYLTGKYQQKEIAAIMGVGKNAMNRVLRRLSWVDVEEI